MPWVYWTASKRLPRVFLFLFFRRIAEKGVKRVDWKFYAKAAKEQRLIEYSYANISETEVRTSSVFQVFMLPLSEESFDN